MKEFKFEFNYVEVPVSELSPLDGELYERAIDATKDAYAPYSNFQVGAALMLTNGKIVTGNNQENAAYPSGLCAERVALFYANAKYPGVSVRTLAIVAMVNGKLKKGISPCGACRQVMLETEERGDMPIRILLCGKETALIVPSVKVLLPLAFSEKDLKS